MLLVLQRYLLIPYYLLMLGEQDIIGLDIGDCQTLHLRTPPYLSEWLKIRLLIRTRLTLDALLLPRSAS